MFPVLRGVGDAPAEWSPNDCVLPSTRDIGEVKNYGGKTSKVRMRAERDDVTDADFAA